MRARKTTPERFPVAFSGPELILPLLVTLIFPKLAYLSILNSPNVHFRKRSRNGISLHINGDQSYDNVIFSKYLVHGDAEAAFGKFHCAPKEVSNGIMANIIP